MIHYLISICNKVINYIVDKLYDGNVVAFKWEPVICTSLSMGTIGGVDYFHALTKVVGAGFLATMGMCIGVLGPMLLRYSMHKIRKKNSFIDELLKHDKPHKEE